MKLTSPDRAALRDLLTRPATAADLKRSLPPRGRLLLGAMGLFGALPYAEEMLRCLRRKPTGKAQPASFGDCGQPG
jgi:hypothetical protein